jgi:hypothetical protein
VELFDGEVNPLPVVLRWLLATACHITSFNFVLVEGQCRCGRAVRLVVTTGGVRSGWKLTQLLRVSAGDLHGRQIGSWCR